MTIPGIFNRSAVIGLAMMVVGVQSAQADLRCVQMRAVEAGAPVVEPGIGIMVKPDPRPFPDAYAAQIEIYMIDRQNNKQDLLVSVLGRSSTLGSGLRNGNSVRVFNTDESFEFAQEEDISTRSCFECGIKTEHFGTLRVNRPELKGEFFVSCGVSTGTR